MRSWVLAALGLVSCSSNTEQVHPPGSGCHSDAECAHPATCGGGGQLGVCGCTYYVDNDHDLYGNPAGAIRTCTPPAGYVLDNTDCNDEDPTINPGRQEICDYKDNNCNGLIDEGVQTTYYRDADGDNYGNPKNTILSCAEPSGFILNGTDCDDTRPDVHPGAAEICDGIDNNCDGIIDMIKRPCNNACGPGMETCVAALWSGCTAPPISVVAMGQTLTLDGSASFSCLDVKGKLQLGADVTISTSGWVQVESGGSIEAGPRAQITSTKDVSLTGGSALRASDFTLQAGGTVSVDGSSRIYLQGAAGVVYSGGGASACSDGGSGGSGGAGGGARGGSGGAGGSCGSTRAGGTPGAGGTAAANGAAGCACACSSVGSGGAPSGGSGGAPMAGGGGGGGGGAGGNGSAGQLGGVAQAAGAGGAADGTLNVEPTAGGAGGGSGGTAYASNVPCQGAGGAGGGVLRVNAASFVNRGSVIADGVDGQSAIVFFNSIGGGGGGGAGGSLVFHVGTFDSTGVLAAQGGNGGSGNTGTAVATCAQATAGGGGGGAGGRIFVAGMASAASATVVSRGSLLVTGGLPGSGSCAQPGGVRGTDGWTFFQ